MKPLPVIPYSQPLPDAESVDGRDEMNLAEFPITLLAFRDTAKKSVLEFEQKARHPETGEEIKRTLTIDAGRIGLPTATDEEVLLVLIQATKMRNGFTSEKVHFSPYELLKLLKWDTNARAYRQLRESLQRWVAVRLSYTNAWYDNAAKCWVSRDFSVITQVDWYEGERKPKDRQQSLPFSNFTWNPVIFQSFRDGYLKRIDYAFYIGLRHPIARRIYRFMDKRFYRIPSWRFDLVEFAFQHVGLSEASGRSTAGSKGQSYTNVNKLKKKLEPGLKELEGRGFLAPLPPAERFVQVARGRWEIVLAKAKADPPPVAAPLPLVAELTRRGVTAKTAAELAAAHEAARIEHHLDVFDWLREAETDRLGKNPAGYLVKSIRDDYAPPVGYLPKAERERKQQAVAAAAAKREQTEAERRRREQAEQAAEQARRDHIERYLAGLTDAERERLEERAIAAGEEWQQRCVRRKEAGSGMLRRLLVEAEVLRVCPRPAPVG